MTKTVSCFVAVVVLLAFAVLGANASVGSPPPVVRANTLVANLRILSFKLGAHAPAAARLRWLGTGMYRTVDNGLPFEVWRNTKGVVDHVQALRAGGLRLVGQRLNVGYRSFRVILTHEGWTTFGCGAGVRGLSFTGRSGSFTFVRWDKRGVVASISLRSQPPVGGFCEGLGDVAPPPVS
jgi:hypothetical protein